MCTTVIAQFNCATLNIFHERRVDKKKKKLLTLIIGNNFDKYVFYFSLL